MQRRPFGRLGIHMFGTPCASLLNMEPGRVCSKTSWLSLVAEAAGMSGAMVARVSLFAEEPRCTSRVIVQMVKEGGQVVGATSFRGDAADLRQGITIDLGYDASLGNDLSLVAFFDDSEDSRVNAFQRAPSRAARRPFLPTVGMKLMLRSRPRIVPSARLPLPHAA